ncbi:LLM class flavin-dependent oxidoreductase [Pseudonocardia spinosispora]|uniref:LLM class flavin-dependent oxidoreductase n=1 Tax=Pseudonocardia spinosispora TaxID=103441 RepID=UPI0003FA234D|nr:LLM class flavin-dependent oxidoreductase [Pseudonocardia spinosispora]
MKLGTSVRFVFPSSAETYTQFKTMLDALPPGGFIERPMGAMDTATQAKNLLEVAAAARSAGLDRLLVGDHHAVPPGYANAFAPFPTLSRLMATTGPMSVGAVLLAPFYNPVLLAEQIGTVAAFADAPLVVTLAVGANPRQFGAFGMDQRSRAGRLEELVGALRPLLAGEQATVAGRYHRLDGVSAGPTPRVPVSLWLAGTVAAAVERAGRIGDGWLTGQNVSRADLVEQLDIYRDSAAKHGRPALPVLRRDIYVGDTDAEAERVVRQILEEGYRGGGMDRLLVGAPETIVEQLEDYRALGFDEVLVRHVVGDHGQMLDSFARIGEGVIPKLHAMPAAN